MKNGLQVNHLIRQVRLLAGWLVALAILLLTGSSLSAYAQTGGSYRLTWWTVDPGGRTGAFGGDYTLHSTAGQPEADPVSASGGGYTLQSGFWPSAKPTLYLYLPLILKAQQTLPDLVGSFSLSPDKSNYDAGEAVLITAIVTNQGNSAADGFWVDFYINPSAAPGVNVPWNSVCTLSPCYGLAWYVPGLGPGQSVTLTSTPGSYAADQSRWPGYFASGTSDLYLYVDSWNPTVPTGGVLESNEGNNQAERHGLTVSGLTVTGDEPLSPQEIPPRPAKLDP